MKRHSIWILAGLTVIELLGFSLIGLAIENEWTKRSDMPTARSALSASMVNGKICAIGRWNCAGWHALPTVEEYDPATDGFDAFISKPFLAERVYECLADLLQVEYEYEEGELAGSLDLTDLEIPSELLSRLKEATEFYDITELKVRLSELAQLGTEGQQLAEHLSSPLNTYEMDGILSVLARAAQSMESS